MNSNKLSGLADVAFASYVDHLNIGRANEDALRGAPQFDRMATQQATEFTKRFTVALPTYHDAYSDLDVTVFKAADGSLTLGIRGTQELALDLLDADADIASRGAAYKQIVALYNWWQRVSTPVSNTAGEADNDFLNGSAVDLNIRINGRAGQDECCNAATYLDAA